MIQILYTNDSSRNETIMDDAREFTRQEDFYHVPQSKQRKAISSSGMIITSLLLIIAVCIVILMGLGSWNMTSKAVSQEENRIEHLPNFDINVKQSIAQTAVALDKNTLKDAQVAEKGVVVKKAIASDGKAYDTVAYLTIPSLGIQYPVLAKTSEALLKVSLNKYWGSNPNQVGNMCIVGHNYNDDRFFGKLNQIEQGAEIIITEMDGEALSYYVYKTDMIDPYDTSCTSQRTNGGKEITLITCNVDGSQRFIAKARANE
ncbi:MAG: sortase [Clostridia bacterium]|nr:sortase [Clostridia bacterium]MCI9247429.1 sortase [Clostridia bacterium]